MNWHRVFHVTKDVSLLRRPSRAARVLHPAYGGNDSRSTAGSRWRLASSYAHIAYCVSSMRIHVSPQSAERRSSVPVPPI